MSSYGPQSHMHLLHVPVETGIKLLNRTSNTNKALSSTINHTTVTLISSSKYV